MRTLQPITDAIKDIGFSWWLFGIVVGFPSVALIVQRVFVDRSVSVLAQGILDSYNAALETFGSLFEPFLLVGMSVLNEALGYHLELNSVWRPLFVPDLIILLSATRLGFRLKERASTVSSLVLGFAMALIGCVIASAMLKESSWLSQAFLSALPFFSLMLGQFAGRLLISLATLDFAEAANTAGRAASRLPAYFFGPALVTLLLLAFGAPERGAGILGLGIFVSMLGAFFVAWGMQSKLIARTRFGLTVLGPFVGASLLYLIDALAT